MFSPHPFRHSGVFGLLLLAACASEPAAVEEDDAATFVAALSDAALIAPPAMEDAQTASDAALVITDTAECDDPDREFARVCLDAAIDAAHDAQSGTDAGVDAGVDATVDASYDASATEDAKVGGPCADTPSDCNNAYFEVQTPTVNPCTVSTFFGSTNIRIDYSFKEICKKAGLLPSLMARFTHCDSCEQVYGDGRTYDQWVSAGATRMHSISNIRFENTEVSHTCMDAYVVLTSFGEDHYADSHASRRVCRCDLTQKKCVRCSQTSCDPL